MIKGLSMCFMLTMLTSMKFYCYGQTLDASRIFPLPASIEMTTGQFVIDTSVFIAIPEGKGTPDFAATILLQELADKYGVIVKKLNRSVLQVNEHCILIGTIANPLIKAYCLQRKLLTSLMTLGDEGYLLSITDDKLVVAANNRKGAMNGVSSLRQVLRKEGNIVFAPKLLVKDAPKYPFRGIKLYLPGKENIPFFKRFVKDFLVLYKYNKLILELNANMRLDRHPELNIGAVKFSKYLKYNRLDRPPGIHKEYQNSSHQDNADGEILEKAEIADLISYTRQFDIEIIPELPSLTHSYYLLAGHEELAENRNQPYPDTYCPLKPGSYKIYFDVLDEYIDVIHPAMIHIGHDEWRMEKNVCDLCRGKDYGQLYADDLKKIHDHLASKGIKTAIWGDHLLESVTEKDHQTWKSSTGYTYNIPGALRADQVAKLVSKDILIFNWFWNDINNDKQLSAFGFKQVYGNMRADMNEWLERGKTSGIAGGAPSSWAGTTEKNFGKDQLYDFLACANLLWSNHYLSLDQLPFVIEPMIPAIRSGLRGRKLPSEEGIPVMTLDISPFCNASINDMAEIGQQKMVNKTIQTGSIIFATHSSADGKNIILANTNAPGAISVNKDVSSLIFLHACTKEALNNKAYDMIYNFDDTAEPLGWYEVSYEDGIVLTIPIRYGLNILDYGWRRRITEKVKEKGKYSQNKYAYEAIAVDYSNELSAPITFFAFEWENPRYGKVIKEIRLRPAGNVVANKNDIVLLALSITEGKKITGAIGTEAQ